MKLKYIGRKPESMSCVSHEKLEKGPYNFVKRICEVTLADGKFLLNWSPQSFEVTSETLPSEVPVTPPTEPPTEPPTKPPVTPPTK